MQVHDDRLTVAEETLRDVLTQMAAAQTGATARAHGWPAPNEAQCAEITTLLVEVFSNIVRGMRDPRALVPGRAEVLEVLEGVALGVLEKVLGTAPTPDVLH